MHSNTYNKLGRFLETKGYKVEKVYHPKKIIRLRDSLDPIIFMPYTAYNVTGKGIVGCFCTPNSDSYTYINGKFAADNAECFDKWSKVPLVMNMKGLDYDLLLKELELLRSQEGFEISNRFGDSVFTYEMDSESGWFTFNPPTKE